MAFEPRIIILECCKDYKLIEKILNQKYDGQRIRGEWFHLCEQDIEDIYEYIKPSIIAKM